VKNLAGVELCDNFIRRELDRARIDIVEGDRTTQEVPYSVTGKLGPFTFKRAWYYWVVQGPMPLEVALELYADTVGKSDVRVAGHCACPPPEPPWVEYYDADGFKLEHDPDGEQAADWANLHAKGHLKSPEEERIRFVADAPATAARAFVESYHIDSEIGLRLFADTVRAKGLAAPLAERTKVDE
jgi:hypothetical protein